MTLPSSGPLSLSQIQTEFGGTPPIIFGGEYRGEGNSSRFGPLRFSDFYGATNLKIHYIILAGGGGGGGSGFRYTNGGGGGAGGLLFNDGRNNSGLRLQRNVTYPVIVGAGGAGGGFELTAPSGGNSELPSFGLTAIGGGGGGSRFSRGANGGSGGGNGNAIGDLGGTGIRGQGGTGGRGAGLDQDPRAAGGGGGGYIPGRVNQNADILSGIPTGGRGGNGGGGTSKIPLSITGIDLTLAAGGGGGGFNVGGQGGRRDDVDGVFTPVIGGQGGSGNSGGGNAVASTGSGGGGASWRADASGTALGGNGSSGIVIISSNLPAVSYAGVSLTLSNSGRFVYIFSSSGNIRF